MKNNAKKEQLNIGAVSNSALSPQLCSDCKNLPCDSYEKHLKCKKCVFLGTKQSNYEPNLLSIVAYGRG